jgi:hypothetical protein
MTATKIGGRAPSMASSHIGDLARQRDGLPVAGLGDPVGYAADEKLQSRSADERFRDCGHEAKHVACYWFRMNQIGVPFVYSGSSHHTFGFMGPGTPLWPSEVPDHLG